MLIFTFALIALDVSEFGLKVELLGQYFHGYMLSYRGAFVGMLYGFFWGFIFGWLIAYLRNMLLAIFWRRALVDAQRVNVKRLLDLI